MTLMAAISGSEQDRGGIIARHLDSLYVFAQSLTLDPDRAAWLVEETFHEAITRGIPVENFSDKRRLFQLMMEVNENGAAPLSSVGGTSSNYRGRIAEQLLDRKLPVALASLPVDLRGILALTELQGLSPTDAAYVMHLEPEIIHERLRQAHQELMKALFQSMQPVERQLVEDHLTGDWLRVAFHRLADREFSALPPTLRLTLRELSANQKQQKSDTPGDDQKREVIKAPSRMRFRSRNYLKQSGIAILLIVIAGLIGYLLTDRPEEITEQNLITLSAQQADDIVPAFRTVNHAQAERFVEDRVQRLVTIPQIDQATLSGVSIVEIAENAEAPVFIFDDQATNNAIIIYAYSYAFLDQHVGVLKLEPDILRQIEDDQHFDLHDFGQYQALIWRNRDDIYVAVLKEGAEGLRDRISFPS